MANHVYQYIEIEGNEDVMKAWKLITDAVVREYKDPERYTEFYPEQFAEYLGMPEYSEDDSHNWYCDNIGAKWAGIEELSDNCMTMTSAWRPCHEWCEAIAKYLSKFDPNVRVINSYEDEFFNFVGVSINEKDYDDLDELSWEEIREQRCNALDMTVEAYDDDEFEDEDLYDYVEELKQKARDWLTDENNR